MFEIGASLREAREHRGLSPADVQKELRIRERYLTALEEERWESLPGEAYVKGFLRTYSEFLGLNGTLYVDEYNARFAPQEDEPFVPESLVSRRIRSGILTRTIVGLLVVAALLAASSAWRPGSPPAPRVADVAVAATPKKRALPRGMPVAPVALPRQKPPTARIRALTRTSWLSVRVGGRHGKELYRGFLEPGHSLRYSLRRNVWLRIGRPGAIAIRVDARLVRGLPNAPVNLLLTKTGPRAG